jgi:hypothetical protein
MFVEPTTCAGMSPTIYKLCYGLLVVNYVVLLLPCLSFAVFVPLLFLCFPYIFPYVSYIPSVKAANPGVSEEVLDKLPKTKYHPGLFNTLEQPKSKDKLSENSDDLEVAASSSHSDIIRVEGSTPECCICKVEYDEGVDVRVLPCSNQHHFHAECVDMWLKRHSTCPLCRKSITEEVTA